uniref:Uncharacterized protein n=1 Tax=Ditylenchus dipsaci TaxID=166011 RepID=A0A915ET63_9BILA
MEIYNSDDNKYRCCCSRFHVERGAYIIAILGIAFGVLGFICSILLSEYESGLTSAFSLLFYVSIIFAQRKQNPSLYWPFLIFNAIGITLIAIYILVLVALLILDPEVWQNYVESSQANKQTEYVIGSHLFTGFMIFFFAMSEVVSVWFQMVVYRAFKYMKMTHSSLNSYGKA